MRIKLILSAVIVIILVACKKDNTAEEQPFLQDGPLSAQLGKMVNLGNYGYNNSRLLWGRNSGELFTAGSTGILRIDLVAQKLEVVDKSSAYLTGKTNENSGLIFLATISNQSGYYVYNFNSNSIEKIITVPDNQGTIINIAGNNIFYYLSPVSIPSPPCNGYCWPLPAPFVAATFYHLHKQSHQRTDLENKQFMLFSTDGSRAILSSQLERRLYVFDNTSRTIIDSSDLNYNSTFGLFYHTGTLQSFQVDVLGNIIIRNFYSGQVIAQYQTNYVALENFRVSSDGTKLYYSGGLLNGSSWRILVYDIATNTEKIIVDIPFTSGAGLSIEYFVLSDDSKKMALQSGSNLYIKELE